MFSTRMRHKMTVVTMVPVIVVVTATPALAVIGLP